MATQYEIKQAEGKVAKLKDDIATYQAVLDDPERSAVSKQVAQTNLTRYTAQLVSAEANLEKAVAQGIPTDNSLKPETPATTNVPLSEINKDAPAASTLQQQTQANANVPLSEINQVTVSSDPNVPGVSINSAADVGRLTPVDPTQLEGYGVQAPVDPTTLEGFGIQAVVDPTTLEGYGLAYEGGATDPRFVSDNGLLKVPEDVVDDPTTEGPLLDTEGNPFTPEIAAAQEAAVDRARTQRALAEQQRQANSGDWRVKLRLAPGARYLYKVPQPEVGILEPLQITDGVVFPYTPLITTSYNANYNQYDLTHSNYRGYFYQNSNVGEIQIQATFTAQDTYEANYLLAVIHFFRSVTKMFYGQDAERGAPPPLVFLQGMGQYQFNLHPCVVKSFNYNLPADVDYIRARSPNQLNTNLQVKRDKQTLPTNPFSAAIDRLRNAGVKKGALKSAPAPATLGTNQPTYVPTKMDMTIVLLPMQTRDQVSKQFSLKQFSNGDLLKGGFW